MNRIKYQSIVRKIGKSTSKIANTFLKNSTYEDLIAMHSKVTLGNRINYPGYGLWLNQEQLKAKGFYIKVDPKIIKKQTKHGYVPFLDNSNWDKYSVDFIPHQSVYEMLENHLAWEETTQYKNMSNQISNGMPAYDCLSQNEVNAYGKKMVKSWDNIKKNGYQIQGFKNTFYPDDIIVSINNDFDIFLERNGTHRLTLSKYLEIKEVYVYVVRLPTKLYGEFSRNEYTNIYSI